MREKRVYFLRPVGQLGPIKIGCSCFPEGRLDTFTIWSPLRLELIASIPGGHAEERTLHGMFKAHHQHGEWFGACKELLSLIEYCVANGALPPLPQVIKFPKTRHKAHSAKRPPKLNKRAWAAAIRAQYEMGDTAERIAEKNGVCIVTALKMVRFAGGKVRKAGSPDSGPRDLERAADIAKRHLAGQTLATIGQHYGISRERVRQILASMKMDRRTSGRRKAAA